MKIKEPGVIVSEDHRLRGILYMCLAMTLIIPFMNMTAKSLTVEFPVIQVVWARFTGHLLCMTLLFWPQRGWRLYRSERPRLQFVRSTLMFFSNACFISALPLVALATASAIMFTAPLLITILAIPLLGERVGRHRLSAVMIGLLGALIIIRPGADLDNIGNLLVLASATAFSFYQILTRKLGQVDPPETMIIYTALVATLVVSLIVPFYFVWPADAWQWLALVVLGVSGAFAQFFVIKAVQYAPVSVVAPIQYTELVGATLFGLFVFGDFPDSWTWFGAAIIVACGLYVAHRERVRRKAAVITGSTE